jgi:predicted transcriptional regulator
MKPFCEIIVSDIMPALRAVVCEDLSKTYGLSQTQISKKLGVTQPAISQYKRDLRGKKVQLLKKNDTVMKAIKKLSHDIAIKDIKSGDIHYGICDICKKVREEGMICDMHKNRSDIKGGCSICFR